MPELLGHGAIGGDGQTINISSRNRYNVAQAGGDIRLVSSIVSPCNDRPVVFQSHIKQRANRNGSHIGQHLSANCDDSG